MGINGTIPPHNPSALTGKSGMGQILEAAFSARNVTGKMKRSAIKKEPKSSEKSSPTAMVN